MRNINKFIIWENELHCSDIDILEFHKQRVCSLQIKISTFTSQNIPQFHGLIITSKLCLKWDNWRAGKRVRTSCQEIGGIPSDRQRWTPSTLYDKRPFTESECINRATFLPHLRDCDSHGGRWWWWRGMVTRSFPVIRAQHCFNGTSWSTSYRYVIHPFSRIWKSYWKLFP